MNSVVLSYSNILYYKYHKQRLSNFNTDNFQAFLKQKVSNTKF